MPGTVGALARSEATRAALIALAVGLALVLLGPPPGDLPAHLYRTALVEDGVYVWDTFWYAGHYPLFSYSLLYYFPAALLGNDLVALVSVVAAVRALRLSCVAGMGRGRSLARAGVRRRRLWAALHRDVPVRGRRRCGARGTQVSPARPALDRDRARRAHARPLAARLPLPVSHRGCGRRRPPSTPRPACTRGRDRAPCARPLPGRPAPGLPTGSGVPVLPVLRAARGARSSCSLHRPRAAGGGWTRARSRLRALGAGGRAGVHGAVTHWRERHPPAGHRAAARAARGLPCVLASALDGGGGRRRRPRVHARPVYRRRRPPYRRPLGGSVLLGPRSRARGRGLDARLPRRGRPHGRSLGVVLGAARRFPARPRLVPAAGHRPEPALLRVAAGARRLPEVARLDGRPLRAPPGHAAGAHRGGARGRARCAPGARGSSRSAARAT